MNRRVLFGAALALAGLAACAQVPTSGPVVEVDEPVADVGSNSFVRALARPPREGMTEIEVVQGFLDAASGFEDGHAVARLYLTDAAAATWDPQVGVRVYGNDTDTLTQPADRQVALNASSVGAISPRSQYAPSPPGTELNTNFRLVQEAGQWRIAELESGLLLSRAGLERAFREYQTYYVARPGGILAPNPVLIASSQRDVTEDLIESLLSGPGSWLAPAVTSAFPAGTTLQSVSVSEGIARVDLSSAAEQADDRARQDLSAQLVWTLRQVPGFRAVVISVDGRPFEVPGEQTVQPRTAWAGMDPNGLAANVPWYFTRRGAVQEVPVTGVASPVAGAAGVGQPPVRDPLVSLELTSVAASDASGRVLTAALEPGQQWSRTRTWRSTQGGSWDRTGVLWLPGRGAAVQAVNVLGARRVPIPLTDVSSVQISRDGSRAIVVAGPRDAAVAYLLRVDRTGFARLGRPRAIATGPVRAAAWLSATQAALLVKQPGQPAQVATVDVGLFSVGLVGGPPRARSVAAAPGRPLLSGTADGRIWSFNGTTWVPTAAGRDPRYPG
ncbi:MAG: LpqB family beta-propeller domain-containing protein [Candidatus Nanopelagicales bacterium]|nr:LpqB family beta-propeller domain-containing protein [Candidatus Nanopelagicales bacterium]